MKLAIHSEESIEPKCRHFRLCGGCSFQHVPYDEQLEQKKAFVSRCFDRAVEPIISSDPAWRYRNKMEFSFSQARSGEKFLGLMKKRGRVENLEECYLTQHWFIDFLKAARDWWIEREIKAYYPPANTGLLRTLTLREGVHSKEKMAVLTVSDECFPEEDLEAFINEMPAVDSLILRRQILQKKVPTRFEERLLKGKDHIHEILHGANGQPFRFRIKAASFFQPNTLQAEVIYQKAIEFAAFSGSESLLDLYCGTGSLGIFAASQVQNVVGIEIVPEATEDAEANIALNGIKNMRVLLGDVQERLSDLIDQPDIVFVDPPRAGLGPKAIAHLLRMQPKKIIYVSCNPVTQAADCQELGYSIERLQPIDQFPHTPHVENIALLATKP